MTEAEAARYSVGSRPLAHDVRRYYMPNGATVSFCDDWPRLPVRGTNR